MEARNEVTALDSQGAITRVLQLYTEPLRSWIEARIQAAMETQAVQLTWVKGHSGIEGNEKADRKANIAAYGGRVMGRPDWITSAGIRQEFPIHSKPQHLKWLRKSLKGLVYIVTDRGPPKRWLRIIGRGEEDRCECREIQNAVHLRRCGLVGDGKGRSMEECIKDAGWCEEVADFLS